MRPLVHGFHAHRTALWPIGESEVAALLEYDFTARSELDDFRSRPGSVTVRSGGLYPAGDRTTTTIESVYWLTPPVRLEGEVDPGASLTLGFGDLRVVPSGNEGLEEEWSVASGLPVRSSSVSLEAPTLFDLRLTSKQLHLRMGETLRVEAVHVPVRGRVFVRLERGGLRWLRIEAGLEMKWARERLRLLESR